MADLKWYYTPVQHVGYIAVHSAGYDENGTVVSIDPTEQTLREETRENLVEFAALVHVGVALKALVSLAEYAAKVIKT